MYGFEEEWWGDARWRGGRREGGCGGTDVRGGEREGERERGREGERERGGEGEGERGRGRGGRGEGGREGRECRCGRGRN